MSVLCIADIGACHDGQYGRMLAAVEAAQRAGVDVLKFQWTSDPDLMARRRGRAVEDGYAAIYRRYLAWPAAWHARLAWACTRAGLEYACTVFLPQDVPTIAPHVKRFKCASFEAGDRTMLDAFACYGKPLMLSTGMVDSVTTCDDWARDPRLDVSLLHCVSAYPAPIEALNLAVLRDRAFDGFSDHSDPALTVTGSWAVAAGAQIVEAHLKLDDTDPANPDAPHAMTPAQFADYVRLIRLCERALGSGEKRQQPCEAKMAQYRVGASQ